MSVKMPVNLIVAMTEDRVIGNKGSIPWKIPEETKLFKELTTGNIVQMMIEHETFHQGQFAAIGYMTGIKLPKTWANEISFHFR